MSLVEVDVIDKLEFIVREDDIRHFTKFLLEIDFLNGLCSRSLVGYILCVGNGYCGHGLADMIVAKG
jgi:hypothetical protein